MTANVQMLASTIEAASLSTLTVSYKPSKFSRPRSAVTQTSLFVSWRLSNTCVLPARRLQLAGYLDNRH